MRVLRDSNSEGGGEGQTATEHNIDILGGTAAAGQAGGEGGAAGGGEGGEGAPAPIATGISEEALTAILQKFVPTAAAPVQQEPPPRQMTQEEYNQAFNVWQPPADLSARLRSEDPAVFQKAMLEMRDGIIKQQSTITEARIQQVTKAMQEAVDSRLTPLQAFYQEQANQALETEFFETNKDLKPFAAIVDAVSAKVCGDGVKRSKKEVFDQVATHSRTVVEQIKKAAGVAPVANGNGNGRPAAGGKTMATLTGGGQQGGRTGGAAPARKPGMAIFDESD